MSNKTKQNQKLHICKKNKSQRPHILQFLNTSKSNHVCQELPIFCIFFNNYKCCKLETSYLIIRKDLSESGWEAGSSWDWDSYWDQHLDLWLVLLSAGSASLYSQRSMNVRIFRFSVWQSSVACLNRVSPRVPDSDLAFCAAQVQGFQACAHVPQSFADFQGATWQCLHRLLLAACLNDKIWQDFSSSISSATQELAELLHSWEIKLVFCIQTHRTHFHQEAIRTEDQTRNHREHFANLHNTFSALYVCVLDEKIT